MKLASKRMVGGRGAGFTILDVTVAMALMLVGLGGTVQALSGAMALERFTRERHLALQGAESALEALQGEVFGETFARFNATAADDLPGANPGNAFRIDGLTPVAGDPDGMVGEIEFPGDGVQLLESVVDVELGMPRDLNADGQPPDLLDHAGDYIVLPVRVRVRWNGVRGDSELSFVTTLNNERKGP